MKITRKKRYLFIFSGAVITMGVLLLIFISPLAKYLLEKYDRQLFGREVVLGGVYVNPFTGYVNLRQVKILEEHGDSIFLTAASIHGTVGKMSLFRKTVRISHLVLDQPKVKVIQKNAQLNFDDLIRKFAPDSGLAGGRWSANIKDVKVINGEIHYIEQVIPINYAIKRLDLETSGQLVPSDTLAAAFSFTAGKGSGEVKGDFTIHRKTYDYRFNVLVRDYDLEIIRQYIWELINYGMFTAHLDARIKATGNFHSSESISATGRIAIRDFHLGKTTQDDYAAFKKMIVVMEELNPSKSDYRFDSVIFTHPYLKYERYDSLDNVQTLFGRKGSNITDVTQQPDRFNLVIEMARYIKVLSRNFFRSDFKINTFRIDQGEFRFNDFRLSEGFQVAASPFTIEADSVNKSGKHVKVFIKSGIQPYGNGSIQLSINPKDSGDFDMQFRLGKIPAPVFNPYLITYTSFPLDRGTLELNAAWQVRNGNIHSTNHLIIVDPRVTKRLRNKDMRWMPMPLIMSLIRERGNVIDYEIPISGNLKNPKFHLWDAVADLLRNIFIKPPTTPYRMEVKNVEAEIEKSLTLTWEMRQQVLRPSQRKFVEYIAKFLKNNPMATLAIRPVNYMEREKEYVVFFEAKKKFFLSTHPRAMNRLSLEDSLLIEKMSVKDPLLVERVGRNLPDTVMFTLHERCTHYVGTPLVDACYARLLRERERELLSLLTYSSTRKQVTILRAVNEIPVNGFSHYKLSYGNTVPESLLNAYHEMLELNEEEPRKEYMKYRLKEKAQPTLKNKP